ncbi:MAG: amidohydrolase, partial [Acidobacteria bacterium]|nr:amidohydrolase [Acidobacteriota bacterium]
MKKTRWLLLAALSLGIAWAGPTDPQAAGGGAGVFVIKDATILPVSRAPIAKGSILVRDGKIAEVGETVAVPAGATVIDAAGHFVTPGIIDPHNHIASDGGTNEGTLAVTSMVEVGETIDPTDINIY